VMSFHTLPLCFGVKMMEPASTTSYYCQAGKSSPWHHVTESNVMTLIWMPFHACPSAVKETNNKLSSILFLYLLLHGFMLNAKLWYDFLNHYSSVFCYGHINFLFVAFHTDGSWLTAARHKNNDPVAISEVFYPTSTH
jgi:hypothetical protein